MTRTVPTFEGDVVWLSSRAAAPLFPVLCFGKPPIQTCFHRRNIAAIEAQMDLQESRNSGKPGVRPFFEHCLAARGRGPDGRSARIQSQAITDSPATRVGRPSSASVVPRKRTTG